MAFFSKTALITTSSRAKIMPVRLYYNYRTERQRQIIGEREIVGNGINSEPTYVDNPAFPFPAIRFREMTGELLALREKEKGNWKRLSRDEKKKLYRASFCQTFAEMQADTGQWKSIIGFGLMYLCVSLWLFMGIRWLTEDELPDTFFESRQEAQLKRMIDLEVQPVTGLSSKWDYEKGEWKKKGLFS